MEGEVWDTVPTAGRPSHTGSEATQAAPDSARSRGVGVHPRRLHRNRVGHRVRRYETVTL